MPEENGNTTANEEGAKPTITIAEKQASATGDAKPTITIAEKEDAAAAGDAKPTITIAEKEGDDQQGKES